MLGPYRIHEDVAPADGFPREVILKSIGKNLKNGRRPRCAPLWQTMSIDRIHGIAIIVDGAAVIRTAPHDDRWGDPAADTIPNPGIGAEIWYRAMHAAQRNRPFVSP